MKKTNKLLLTLLLVLLTAVLVAVGLTAAAKDPAVIASGYCGAEGDGTNVAWTLTDDWTLTISGTGAMATFEESIPWDDVMELEAVKAIGFESVEAAHQAIGTIDEMSAEGFRLGAQYLNCYRSMRERLRVVIEEGVTSIGANAFNCHTELITVSLPDTLKSIGDKAFCYCENMTDFIFPEGVETIGVSAFGDCRGLRNVILPEALTELEYGAFQCCNAIEKITLSDSVKSIAETAFYACFSLKEINLPASLTRIEAGAFASCESLEKVVVERDSYAETFCAKAGLPYAYAQAPVVFGSEGGDGIGWKLENGTLMISGTGAMDNYMRMMGGSQQTTAPWDGQKITQVVVEPGITSIGAFAFWGCEQLKTVVLPDTVTVIGKFAFENCILLREITLPDPSSFSWRAEG